MEHSDYLFSSDGIILILGVTGAGKSYFINQLKPRSVREGHSLQSETSKCQAVQIILDDEEARSITIVDTPGFDDTSRPHGEVLCEITEFLAVQHELGMPLRGVMYFHKITDNRMTGSSRLYLNLLESLVGRKALKNVVLVTTMWNKLRDEDYGEAYDHEQELVDKYWRPLRRHGASLAQFDGSKDAAFALVWQLAGKRSVVLDIQREILDEGQDIRHTAAGSLLMQREEAQRQNYEMKLDQLSRDLERQWAVERPGRDESLDLQSLKRQEQEAQEGLSQIDTSISKMGTRPKAGVKERIKRLVGEKAAMGASTILAAALNITLFVVNIAGGG